ncbi:MAG: type II toxin-antitoxin system VapC family toxin [Candidatus Phosphoribacter sp.]
MIIDSSALVAILGNEPEAQAFGQAVSGASRPRISAASLVETYFVIDGRRRTGDSRRLDELIDAAGIAVEPFTERQARIAREAFRDYGKGSGHPARLNLGDCFAYALAKDSGEPLLYTGDDFAHTDVRAVFPGGRVPGARPLR